MTGTNARRPEEWRRGGPEEDRQSIAAQGLTIEEVDRQLALFRRGVPPVRLNRPCVAGDGIVVIPESERPIPAGGLRGGPPDAPAHEIRPRLRGGEPDVPGVVSLPRRGRVRRRGSAHGLCRRSEAICLFPRSAGGHRRSRRGSGVPDRERGRCGHPEIRPDGGGAELRTACPKRF